MDVDGPGSSFLEIEMSGGGEWRGDGVGCGLGRGTGTVDGYLRQTNIQRYGYLIVGGLGACRGGTGWDLGTSLCSSLRCYDVHDIHYIHDIFTIVENTSLNKYANLYIFCIILSSLTLDHTVQSIHSTRIKLLTSLDIVG